MKISTALTLATIALLGNQSSAMAQQQAAEQKLPVSLTLPTQLVNHLASQLQSMSTYQGGVAEREAQATLLELQQVAAPQLQQHPTVAPMLGAEHNAPTVENNAHDPIDSVKDKVPGKK